MIENVMCMLSDLLVMDFLFQRGPPLPPMLPLIVLTVLSQFTVFGLFCLDAIAQDTYKMED